LALLEGHIVTHQIGSGNNDNPPTLTFYIGSAGVRRELIPDVRDGQPGYRCVTITSATPLPQDKRVKTQTDFEKILVDMRLMHPVSSPRVLGPVWPTGMDNSIRKVNRVVDFFTGSRTKETWLPLLK
jgi:hypothetical protein